jgi:hypothetical protein
MLAAAVTRLVDRIRVIPTIQTKAGITWGGMARRTRADTT